MIESTQTRKGRIGEKQGNSFTIYAALRPWRRRFALQQLWRWTLRGCSAGLLLACLILLLARVFPWEGAAYWAVGALLTGTLLALILALRARPTLGRTARLVDRRLKLSDRLGTAWELREETSTLATLQRRDALSQLASQSRTPAKTLPLRPSRRQLGILALLLLAGTLLFALPNPMTLQLQQQAALQARIAKQIAAIDHLRKEITQSPALTKEQQQKIDQLLQELNKNLQQAKSEAEAQQAIAQAQAKLDKLRNPQTANTTQGQNAASSTLQKSSDSALKSIGQALATNDEQNLANALQKLQNDFNKLSPDQRRSLAQQLEKAANDARQNPQLSSALHDLAKALSDGNASEFSDAAKALQAAAKQTASAQAKEQGVNKVSQSLQEAANNLAASTDSSTSTQQGQGQGAQQGQTQGQTPAQGQGKSTEQGQGKGQGQEGQGGGNGSKGSNSAGSGQGKNEQVYVPGQVGTGTGQQSKDDQSGKVQPGKQVPYSKVIADYDQAAHDAIDNSNVSPEVKDLVHDYFDSLEGQ